MNPPVKVRRLPEPMSNGVHLWQVDHNGELAAQFTSGTAALHYVDSELSAWYRQRRDNQAAVIKAAVGGFVGLLAKNAATKRQGRK